MKTMSRALCAGWPLPASLLPLVSGRREGRQDPKQPPLAQRNQMYLETLGNKAM